MQNETTTREPKVIHWRANYGTSGATYIVCGTRGDNRGASQVLDEVNCKRCRNLLERVVQRAAERRAEENRAAREHAGRDKREL